MLADGTEDWPVILAADVFCYFGELFGMFASVKWRLGADGLFVFSLEAGDAEAGWQLGAQGRYSHSADYVEHVARVAGFHVRELVAETMRFEIEQPVEGLLVVLEHVSC